MASFQQVLFNLAFGVVIGSASLTAFGFAIRYEYNNQLAPRSWSRPKAVLKNVLKPVYALNWIYWSLQQSYPDLLEGIPGTGTRNGGWSGPLLKTNLDGIIMLKFHSMLTKVALLATFLCLLVLLPSNITAKCNPDYYGWGNCISLENLTSFEECTIVHIPPIDYEEFNFTEYGMEEPAPVIPRNSTDDPLE